jgi:hypothetical protein
MPGHGGGGHGGGGHAGGGGGHIGPGHGGGGFHGGGIHGGGFHPGGHGWNRPGFNGGGIWRGGVGSDWPHGWGYPGYAAYSGPWPLPVFTGYPRVDTLTVAQQCAGIILSPTNDMCQGVPQCVAGVQWALMNSTLVPTPPGDDFRNGVQLQRLCTNQLGNI